MRFLIRKGSKDGERVIPLYSDVIEWLESVRKLDEVVKNKSEERMRLMTIATNITPELDGMPHGTGKTDKVGNIAVKLATLAEKQANAILRHEIRRSEVITALEQLPLNEYTALYKCYIDFMTDSEIADDMERSPVQVWRYKQKGIKKLEKEMKRNKMK